MPPSTPTADAALMTPRFSLWRCLARHAILPIGVFALDWPLATALLGVSAEVFLGYLLASALPLVLGTSRTEPQPTATGHWLLRFLIGAFFVGFVASVAIMVGALGLLGAWMMIRTLAGPGPIPLPWHAVLSIAIALIWFASEQVQAIRLEHRDSRASERQRLRMLETLYKVVVVAKAFLIFGMFASKLGDAGLRYVIPICALGFVWSEWLAARQRQSAFAPLPPMAPLPPVAPEPRKRSEREDYC